MFVRLGNRALIKLTGKDSESFLQSQLSNDINKLDNSSIQLSAYCQHQGKILVLFWVIRAGDNFLLSFPLDLLDSIKARLQMFVLMADVMITDVTEAILANWSDWKTSRKIPFRKAILVLILMNN